ncbi:MAG: ribonuclease Y [Dehalococcoidales bacterium]|nr:ribonuclease Y [Dehalococcoidales bacterium]
MLTNAGALNILTVLFSFIIGAVAGAAFVFFFRRFRLSREMRLAERKAAKIQTDAEHKARDMVGEAKTEAAKLKSAAEAECRERRSELQRNENRLVQKEGTLERKLEDLERRARDMTNKEEKMESIREQLEEARGKQLKQLEIISGMSTDEAKKSLLDSVEVEIRDDTSRRLREWENELRAEENKKAQEILSLAIQRCASDVVAEATVSIVAIPSDDMKGRLIGREGRNIRALEQATGVDLIIDDTPEAVTLSSFDPVRREVARLALTKLILDGRIHPARIEEVVAKSKEEVEAAIYSAGEQAACEVGVTGLRPELLRLLGRLKFRTSYGQNVLVHSIEVAHISGMIASELGANVAIAKKTGLLHDIGKAVDHEVEGTHAAIGADLVKQWDKSSEVVRGIAEHHGETGTTSVWGFIASAADAISSARPGARRESLEGYLQRLKALEDIATGFKGVEKSFAIQAGREIRIMVKPEEIDDLGAMRLARDIVKKIEEGLQYPGQIKVIVLRETRAVDYAK